LVDREACRADNAVCGRADRRRAGSSRLRETATADGGNACAARCPRSGARYVADAAIVESSLSRELLRGLIQRDRQRHILRGNGDYPDQFAAHGDWRCRGHIAIVRLGCERRGTERDSRYQARTANRCDALVGGCPRNLGRDVAGCVVAEGRGRGELSRGLWFDKRAGRRKRERHDLVGRGEEPSATTK